MTRESYTVEEIVAKLRQVDVLNLQGRVWVRRRLMLPVTKDTLLRVVRRHAVCDISPLCVIGTTIGLGNAVSVTAASLTDRFCSPPCRQYRELERDRQRRAGSHRHAIWSSRCYPDAVQAPISRRDNGRA
jgi:hypothetical protein